MNEKMTEAAINGNFTEFSDMLKEELNRRVHELIESRIQDVTDDTWNVCESCDEDNVWDDDDIEALYDDEEDSYEDDEEDLQDMNIGESDDDHGARELHLYADNHADLHRQRMTPIHKNLRNKMASGKYDHEKAKKLFKYAADDAAKRYKADHGHHFDVKTRKAVAGKMADQFHDEAKDGHHDHHLHKKHKGHKVGESVDHTDEAVNPKVNVISRDEYKERLKALGTSKSKLKKMRKDAAKKAAAEGEKNEDVNLDELKMPARDDRGRLANPRVKRAVEKGAIRAADKTSDHHADADAAHRRDDQPAFNAALKKAKKTDRLAGKRFRQTEDAEQVDELKKDTLLKYKEKAKQDKNLIARDNQSTRGPLVGRDRRDFRNRSKGIDGATKRLISKQYDEEVEQIDELDAKTLIRYNNAASQQVTRDTKTDTGKVTPKTVKRLKGALKARKKLDKIMPGLRGEEVEQVDEKEDHVYHVSNIDYDADKRSKRRLPKKMKVRVPHDVHKDGQDAVDDHISDHISDTTGWLHKGYNSRRVKEEVEQVDELMMPAKDSEGRIKRGKIRAALRRGGQRARDAADKHYDAAANTHPDDHKGFVSSTQKAVDKDKVAKRRERAAEEVSVDEAMGGQKKRKKKAKKDYDGDGKIETGSQEFMGSRDKAIKAAMAARGGN